MAEKSFLQESERLMRDGVPTDCVFIIGGNEFHCHKSQLIKNSEIFGRMFNEDFEEAKSMEPITLDDVEPEILTNFLDYIYYGDQIRIKLLSADALLALIKFGSKYMVQSLKNLCNETLVNRINLCSEKEFIAIFSYAHFIQDENLIGLTASRIRDSEIVNYANAFVLEPNVFYELTKVLKGSFSEFNRYPAKLS